MKKKKILGAAVGTCVHVAGLHHFLKLAEAEGFETFSLGPAVSIERLVDEIRKHQPDMIALSYRLTPEVAARLFDELKAALPAAGLSGIEMIFGGTPPVAEAARNAGLFAKVFGGQETLDEIKAFLRGGAGKSADEYFPHDLAGRIEQKYPYPIIRHHFGQPTLRETVAGVKTIAEAGVIDVISLGPDQNAQEHFFHPEEMDHAQDGAGGVPLRRPEDMEALYENSRCGNYPLMRCYSGTRDLIRWAEMSVAAIHNAWGAIPLCWYSIMDGRSQVPLVEAIAEKLSAIRWYAERGIPVEVNESHQWSLRDAHDSLAVATAFLAAYNARKAGVRRYVSQYMFNTPPGTWPNMDIAKMMAKNELIESLQDDAFTVYREVRAGIAHFSPIPSVAKGQVAASAVISLALKPHILHVVGFSEGDHAVNPKELIESCEIIHGVLSNCLYGLPAMEADQRIRERKEELISEARTLLEAINQFGAAVSADPWSDPRVLTGAIENGLLDTPHFRGNPHVCGKILTRLIDGAWYAVDEKTGEPIREKERTEKILMQR
ncbi:MAG: cobalamin B12-binding domain-containing protein [Deltaproteobacteria bacterium]|nr:cobalamin B12-binding domain-containing protein [Deltaproteobacteria bacterium]